MATNILGVSCFFHDAAVALLKDAHVVFAAQEERYSRIKNDARFPRLALLDALRAGGLQAGDIDVLAYYEDPWRKFPRVLQTLLEKAPSGIASFGSLAARWSQQLLPTVGTLSKSLGDAFRGRTFFVEHHASHAGSAFYPSPFDEAAILTIDAVGEWATSTIGIGRGNDIRLLRELTFPQSIGMLYSAFTWYTGFEVNEGEYKLMGLAPYGEPRFADLIRHHVVEIDRTGAIALDMSYFDFVRGRTMTSRKLHELFGGPPRRPDEPLTQRHADLAASIQKVCEEIVLNAARHAHELTGMRNLCMAGGVALNCVANGRLQREGPFEQIWVQPAAGDAGSALGAGLVVAHQVLGIERRPIRGDAQQGSLLGPSYPCADIRLYLEAIGATYEHFDDEGALLQRVATLLSEECIIGWFHGRMEFGPRALGCRSILGDPRPLDMQSRINRSIKFRESFRPFAPVVLRERAAEYFDLPDSINDSPYMLFVHQIKERWRLAGSIEAQPLHSEEDLIRRLDAKRSNFQATTHVDFSARLQTVDEARHGRFCRLLRAFEALTGCPILVNTSFNVKGEPIVRTPEDAFHCFMKTDIDCLVLENALLMKGRQDPRLKDYVGSSH